MSDNIWEENRKQLAYKPFAVVQPSGRGFVIAFTQDPTIRAYLDGRFCFVSSRKSDTVSVISFDDGRELARIKVGTYPQRMWAVAIE